MHVSLSLSEVFSVGGNSVVTTPVDREFSASSIIGIHNLALFLIMPPTPLIDQSIVQQNPFLPPPHLHGKSFLCPVDVGFGQWDSAWPPGIYTGRVSSLLLDSGSNHVTCFGQGDVPSQASAICEP